MSTNDEKSLEPRRHKVTKKKLGALVSLWLSPIKDIVKCFIERAEDISKMRNRRKQ
jgi:hypothetical protein